MLVSDRRLCERIVRANRSTRYSVPKTGNVCRQGYSRVSPRFLRSCPGWGLAPHISTLTYASKLLVSPYQQDARVCGSEDNIENMSNKLERLFCKHMSSF